MIYVRVNVGIFRYQERTHPPSDELHFIVMDANLSPNKGPAEELSSLSQIDNFFGFEPEDIHILSMLQDPSMQNSQLNYDLLEAVNEIQETRIVDSDHEGQKHTTHDDDQLFSVLGAAFEGNTCQHLPSGFAEDFTWPTNSNDFGVEDQDGNLFTVRPNQQLHLSGYISKPESPNPQLPTCSESPFPNLVPQGLPFLGGNMDNLWNRNKPFQREKEYFIVEPAKKLTWIGDSGLVVPEPTPGNIFAELKLPPVHEDPGLPNLQLPGSGGLEQLPGDGKIYRAEHTINCRTS